MGDRLARVLSARLEELATAAERSGASAPVVGLLLEAASVATVRLSELHFQNLAARAELLWRLLRSRWIY